ncbi:unnamed protein product [Caenorhabditis angaria]|uniref:C-type lectin domain-containing protein n=1 Tax=Caenorhabditis angaria TaxID=860376 RepID=A0A9P1I703_9PELO|nr:unnamed protein product [Caenorhabditis angaria]
MLLINIMLMFQNFGQACIPTQQIETTTTTTSTTTTPIIYGCPDSTWTVIDRTDYSWCAYILNGPYLMRDYETECANIHANAVVWGIQDAAELQTVLTLIRAVQTVSPSNVCLGALRTSDCDMAYGLTPTCTTLTSYAWNDGNTDGTDGFIWAPGKPSNEFLYSGYPYTYMYMLILILVKCQILIVVGMETQGFVECYQFS